MKLIDRVLQAWRFHLAAAYIPVGSRVLDIGARDGALLMKLEDRIGPSVGIDPMMSADSHVGPHEMLAGYFPGRIPQGKFDAAVLLAVVEHMSNEDLEEAGRLLASVVRPDGSIIVTIPSPAVDQVLKVLLWLGLAEGMDAHAHHGFDVSTLVPLWEAQGLQLKTRRRFQLGLNNLFVFQPPGDALAPPSSHGTVSPGGPS